MTWVAKFLVNTTCFALLLLMPPSVIGQQTNNENDGLSPVRTQPIQTLTSAQPHSADGTETNQSKASVEATIEAKNEASTEANNESSNNNAFQTSTAQNSPIAQSPPSANILTQSPQNLEVGRHVATNNLELSSMLLSLIAVLAMIFLAASVLKKFKLGAQLGGELKVITSLHIGTKERLVVVEVAGKQLLLGVTANNISILQELEQPLSRQQAMPVDFGASLSKLLKK